MSENRFARVFSVIVISLVLCILFIFLINLNISDGVQPVAGSDFSALAQGANIRKEVNQLPENKDSAANLCPGGPTVDGILLDECVIENFTVGGDAKSITVYYTKNISTVYRIVGTEKYTLTHGITSDQQAINVATWGSEAWQRYHEIFGRHPYEIGCSDNINISIEDGDTWAGLAPWPSPGKCWIKIDAPGVILGHAHRHVYHEFQHFIQYAYNEGCATDFYNNYHKGAPKGNAEFFEGYADVASDGVDPNLDLLLFYYVGQYNPEQSFYDKSYQNVFSKYFVEQLGSQWTPADPHHHMDAVRAHYEECDQQDTIYVLDTLIPKLKFGMTKKKFFLNFFAANWAKDWADPDTQPELVYLDDDVSPAYGSIKLYKNEKLAGGSKRWDSQQTPDDWAGHYYQIEPQSGCEYITIEVDGNPGAKLGINLMAARTSGTPHVLRSAIIGEDLVRTFRGYGVHDKVVAVVNGFEKIEGYAVRFSCQVPTLKIIEPVEGKHAFVGEPESPVVFLARFSITSGGSIVRGVQETDISAFAGSDPVDILPDSLSQVGNEYWAIMVPPKKPTGTTFNDLKICLNSSLCVTETDALLYEPPEKNDFALVFDGSSSMEFEDVTGEGQRYVNAQKAGIVLADLMRVGDRVLVTDFSAFNDPPGCYLPFGDGDCVLDIITRLPRTDVVEPAWNTIAATRDAINNITPRLYTPIGGALLDAKDQLLAGPANTNPKHIILLSDGDENVHPLYSSVRNELINSGVIIDTIAYSSDSPADFMAQIAADTGGEFRSATTSGGSLASAVEDRLEVEERLWEDGLMQEQIDRLTTDFLPGPLALDDIYDYYETVAQGATRLYHQFFTGITDDTPQTIEQFVDQSVNRLRIVVAGKQEDTSDCEGFHRSVLIQPPWVCPECWIEVSPANPAEIPANWDIRNSDFDDVLIVTDPMTGRWRVKTRYYHTFCIEGGPQDASTQSPDQNESDFMINISAETDIRLTARFLSPIVDKQGMAGDRVPIVAALIDHNKAMPAGDGYGVVGVIHAMIQRPGGSDMLYLYDDGDHHDGNPDDGIFGGVYTKTDMGGTYNVRLVAYFQDTVGQMSTREWNGSFWIRGPESNDNDDDGMPDDWERRCQLNTSKNDAGDDPDEDNLTNYEEFLHGTIPCDADTDDGGEQDGSEVTNNRDPLEPDDDLVFKIAHWYTIALNSAIKIIWTHPDQFTSMHAYISTDPNDFGRSVNIGTSGEATFSSLSNNQTYYIRLSGKNGDAVGDYSEVHSEIPKSDPDPPNGIVTINNYQKYTNFRAITLTISASDYPIEGAITTSRSEETDPNTEIVKDISGVTAMRISNDVTFAGSIWEPYELEKNWILDEGPMGYRTIFIQFRDAAGNISSTQTDDILYIPPVYLPLIFINTN